MDKLIAAGAIMYVIKDNKVLYLLLKHLQGHWSFPKGCLQEGESLQEGAKREIKEETGLKEVKFIGAYKWTTHYKDDFDNPKEANYFLAEIPMSDIKLSEEHTEFGYFELDEALEKIGFKNMQDVVKEADKIVRKLP